MPADARRAAAIPMPSPCHILAQGPAGCQLGCANIVAGKNVKGNLHTTQRGESIPHMGVNTAHDSPAADRSLIAVGINENKNLALLLRPYQQLLQRVKVLMPTNKLRESGTPGTDDATDHDHGFFPYCGLTAGMIIQEINSPRQYARLHDSCRC